MCRNGHVRTPENTHLRSDGGRQCKDCPGYKRKSLSTRQRRLLDEGLRSLDTVAPDVANPSHYDRLLSAAELDYLKSLIPCVGCGASFGAPHRWGCEVPFNVEDDGTAEPSPKNARAA